MVWKVSSQLLRVNASIFKRKYKYLKRVRFIGSFLQDSFQFYRKYNLKNVILVNKHHLSKKNGSTLSHYCTVLLQKDEHPQILFGFSNQEHNQLCSLWIIFFFYLFIYLYFHIQSTPFLIKWQIIPLCTIIQCLCGKKRAFLPKLVLLSQSLKA